MGTQHCHMGIRNNTHAILEHAPPSPLRLPHIMGIKNNTRIIADASSSSARHAPHITGIKINTHTILEHAPPSPLRLPHITGIKINTHITTDAPQPQQDTSYTSRVLKIIPMLHGTFAFVTLKFLST